MDKDRVLPAALSELSSFSSKFLLPLFMWRRSLESLTTLFSRARFSFARSEASCSDSATLAEGQGGEKLENPFTALSESTLVRIFTFACQPSYPSSTKISTEQTLSHVCTQWRRISLYTPGLWTLIPPTRCPSKQAEMIHMYLQRCPGRRIDLYLNLSSDSSTEVLVPLLLQNKLRWRSISVCCSNLDSQDMFLARVVSTTAQQPLLSLVPKLEHFSLFTLEEMHASDVERLHDVASQPSHLSAIPISASTLRLQDQGATIFPYSVEGITTLHIEQFLSETQRPAPFLKEVSSHLVNLSIHGCFEFNSDIRLNMPCLVSLRYCGKRQLSALLTSINAPLLESLVLKNLRDYHIREFQDNYPVTSKKYKFPSLYHLKLDNAVLSKATMTRLFIDFNSISQLEYINSSAEDILDLLSGDGMEAELPLPFLETLSIHYFRSVAFGSGATPGLQPHIALSHLVTSRSLKANRPLTCLRVHTCVPLSSGTKAWSVELMRWSELNPWPRERDYPDLHDPFMVLSQPPLPVEIPEVAPAPTNEKGRKFRKLYNW